MKVAFSNRSVRQYGKLSAVVQARFDKQLGLAREYQRNEESG